MPVPEQRDPATTCARLSAWLSGRLPGAHDVTVENLSTPSISGFSSETLMFEAVWTDDASKAPRREALVARVGPTTYNLFPDPRFEEQCRVLQILDRDTDIPVPRVRWYEPDPTPLGAPFLVMDHVQGRVPGDQPPYHVEGWVAEQATPEDRARMWWRSLDVLSRIHRLDVDALGLGFVDRPELGRSGIDQQLGYYERFLDWTGVDLPLARETLAWLRANQPAEADPPRLLWGDSRIGNVIYRDGDLEPVAVLDWEMVTLGQPEMDLAWFLYLDRHHSEGVGSRRLPGFPTPEETVAAYERLLGRPMRDLAYYEVFAGLRFTVIMARIGRLFIEFGILPPDTDFPTDNTASRLLGIIRC